MCAADEANSSTSCSNLLQHLQKQLQETAVQSADAALEKAQLAQQIGDLETRIQSRQKQNDNLFRRVQMLEDVLQLEMLKTRHQELFFITFCRRKIPETCEDQTPQYSKKRPPPFFFR